jgi:bifunctional non-homologous end joining protein LigD
MKPEHAHLRFSQGSADKVYNAHLVEVEDGWLVNFAYGRRGKPLRTGTKTAKAVSYELAKKAYDKLVTSKMAKGYTSKADGTPFTAPEKAGERTSWLPQLLNPVEREDLLEMFSDWPSIWGQVKHDGERRGIIFKQDEIIPANRKGLRTTIAPEIMKDLKALNYKNRILDTEDMGDSLVIFDVLRSPTTPFITRVLDLSLIQERITTLGLKHIRVDMPRMILGSRKLAQFIDAAETNNEEGVVFRNGGSHYTPGRPSSGGDCIKYKFYASATCIVESIHPTKRSIGLGLWDNNSFEKVGNCTIPPNYKMPRLNNLVEIKYLYAYRGGSLYQPQYKGVRNDLDQTAATTTQLKYKE